jgi:hypothetical protein
MRCFDMMRGGITKKDAISCLILVLLRGLVFEGLARDFAVGFRWAGSRLRCEPLRAW